MITHIRAACVPSTTKTTHLSSAYVAEPELRVIDVTDDSEKSHYCKERCASEWCGRLSPSQHITCENVHRQVLSDNGMHLREWALERYEADGSSDLVSSMDSIERLAYVKLKGKSPMLTVNHVIDSVFTPSNYRGKGYARTLVGVVTAQLESIVDPVSAANYQFTPEALDHSLITLWSDVGDFYRPLGFDDAMATQIVVPKPEAHWPEGVEALGYEHSRDGVETYCERMLASIDAMTEQDGVPRAVVAPTKEILLQMQARAFSAALSLGLPVPEVFGARVPGGDSWIAWSFQFDAGTLSVLGIYGPLTEMVALFQAAVSTAATHGLQLVMYEGELLYADEPMTGYFLEALQNADIDFVYETRKGSIPYYLRSGSRANLKLEFPGKYSWY